ncbi:hypothetical protein V9T40_002361 [Parthenolecanium corni]|uniref:Uncharacterized protein n=1 Tax=Parthenolecanium corni TaxID=536013 RepID=A0AAN9Y5I9_9HEMI
MVQYRSSILTSVEPPPQKRKPMNVPRIPVQNSHSGEPKLEEACEKCGNLAFQMSKVTQPSFDVMKDETSKVKERTMTSGNNDFEQPITMSGRLPRSCVNKRQLNEILLGVPQDLIADQVTTTTDKCTVLFAGGQTASFRITEVREGRRIIQQPAVLVELESGKALPVIPVQLLGNKASTGGATSTATDPQKRDATESSRKDTQLKNAERVEDFTAPINSEHTDQQPSTLSGSKTNSGMKDCPMNGPKQESKKSRLYYNVICKCLKTDKPEEPPARDTLRRKAMCEALQPD